MRTDRLLLTLLCSTSVFAAQVPAQDTPGSFGIIAGYTRSSLTTNADLLGPNQRHLSSLTLGISYTIPVTTGLSWRPELLYSRKGYTTRLREVGGGNTYEAVEQMAISYLEIPVLAQLTLPASHNITAMLLAGPALSVKTGCSYTDYARWYSGGNEGGTHQAGSCSEPEDAAEISALDLGVVVGGGLQFRKFSLEARYNFGLSNIAPELINPGVKNRTLTVAAGMRIGGRN